ncbi:hypothetical protein JAAARDRAFT_683452 [Jaapia argillacea MUCL 33604]|uniref:F-box domain-containing protein n=1 Tax=Jaapia argillacea MUCL 33604 TaxID=933084 RepID=A0A067QNW8_9AGAM|nr:hypothetical protein JAAARDRAFT_683452 [Jaapia argillacea MUCL 33604]
MNAHHGQGPFSSLLHNARGAFSTPKIRVYMRTSGAPQQPSRLAINTLFALAEVLLPDTEDIKLTIPSLEYEGEMWEGMSAIGQGCPRLKRIVVHVKTAGDQHCFGVDIAPLYNCHHLEHFEIRHPHPLKIDDDDVARMLNSWPVQYLTLNPRPSVTTELCTPIPTLSTLLIVQQQGPHLVHLGVFLDPRTPGVFGSAPHGWDCLQILDLGLSSNSQALGEREAAHFIFQSLPPTCEIVANDCSMWVKYVALILSVVLRPDD